jgi:L-ascorbate metabolism protein UlaG (beta-lactamase superfamily)
VEQGAVIWKLDNDGFVVKTRHHTYGFDVSDLAESTTATAERRATQLAEALDASFTSHRHGDHLNPPFMQKMVARGKPVVIPPDLWSDDARGKGMLRTAGGEKRSVAGLSCAVFPGHQVDVPNNVYLVTADGMSIMHAGDQFQETDFCAWIDDFGNSRQTDVLLVSCWALDLPRMVQGIRPKLIITGHENELWHPVCERESFEDAFEKLSAVHCPSVVMTWGEKFTWTEVG